MLLLPVEDGVRPLPRPRFSDDLANSRRRPVVCDVVDRPLLMGEGRQILWVWGSGSERNGANVRASCIFLLSTGSLPLSQEHDDLVKHVLLSQLGCDSAYAEL